MLVGYVSDERYVALPDVLVEFSGSLLSEPVVARSTPRGEIFAGIAPGSYEVTLARAGYGSKRVHINAADRLPHQFRLLTDRLIGYMSPQWSKSGGKSEYRVHAVEEYRLSLWRYGLRKEFIRLIGWYDEHGPRANMQITPDGDYTQSGVEWNKIGYGNVQLAQMLTAPERSGLYYIHAETPSGKFFTFPWVVAPARPSAPVAVLMSSNTWNAYNNFGGRSNYINPTGLPETPVVNARQDLGRYRDARPFGVWSPENDDYLPLSFDRPDPASHVPEETEVTDPIRGRLACAHAPGEWRLLGWLEREDFAYDLYADAQLHSGDLPLESYKVLIISVHPEYWTREMFSRVQAWIQERQGRLMYLGGNGVNCEVTISADGKMRCLSHYPETSPDAPDRLESRMHNTFKSEAELLGVVFTETGIMTAAPYEVIDASHWVFAGTNLQNGDLFGELSLHERIPGGASGHETDKLSPSSPQGTQLLAKGTNPDNGGGEMAYYQTASGGEVFAVGSISYVSSLFVDSNVSRITANVLSRFLA